MPSDSSPECHTLSNKSRQLFWHINDISYNAVNITFVYLDETLLLLVAAASFVESALHVYSRNLVEHFYGDSDIIE